MRGQLRLFGQRLHECPNLQTTIMNLIVVKMLGVTKIAKLTNDEANPSSS